MSKTYGFLPDRDIARLCQGDRPMIAPFVGEQVRRIDRVSALPIGQAGTGASVVSFGLSSAGYDIRVADEFKIFTNVYSSVVDPKHFEPDSMVDFTGSVCTIPPNSFVLARTVEYFIMPRDVVAFVTLKSTYARCGIIVASVTIFEPEWKGFATLEISNTTPLPARVYANEGIAQVLFYRMQDECRVSYADRKGKYQGQTGVVPAKV